MHDSRSKILGTLLFIILISGLVYLTFISVNRNNKGQIKMINITGNKLLSADAYKDYTKLIAVKDFEDLTLPVIKDRFYKHPYISKVEVEYVGNNTVEVSIVEQKINAILLQGSEPYLITNNFEVLPLLPNTKLNDVPVISNPKLEKPVKTFSILKNEGIMEAFKIIEAAKLTNDEIEKRLSEINLRNGRNIILTFSGIKPPVIFGRGQEAKKMVYLEIMWNEIAEGKNLIDESDYIDLRFADEIYVGKTEKTGLTE